MTKQAFDKIAAGLRDALDVAEARADPATYRLHRATDVDVKSIRKRLSMTQVEFASRFGFNVACLRDWEQRRSGPDSVARAYLTVIAKAPELVEQALAGMARAGDNPGNPIP